MSPSAVNSIIKWFSRLLLAVSAIIAIYIYSDPNMSNQYMALAEGASRTGVMIVWGYILLALACLLAILFPLIEAIQNPKKLLRVLGLLIAMGLLITVAYLFADSTPLTGTATNPDFSNASIVKWTDAGIIVTYIMLGATLLALLFSSVRNFLNK